MLDADADVLDIDADGARRGRRGCRDTDALDVLDIDVPTTLDIDADATCSTLTPTCSTSTRRRRWTRLIDADGVDVDVLDADADVLDIDADVADTTWLTPTDAD